MNIADITLNRTLTPRHVAWLSGKFGKSITIKPSWVELFTSIDRAHLSLLFPNLEFKSGGLAILDRQGNIFQVRPDIQIGDAKYLTVCSQPAYIDWCDDADTVVITEGMAKACAVELVPNCNAIALSGVGNWQQDLAEIKRYCANKKIVIAFDSDSQYNLNVELQQEKLAQALDAQVVDFGNLAGSAKGLDDLVKAHGKKALIHVIKTSAHNANIYFIPDEDRFMSNVPFIWKKLYPDLVWTGLHWIEDAQQLTEVAVKRRYHEIARQLFTIHPKAGKRYSFAKNHARVNDGWSFLKELVQIDLAETDCLFVQNGRFDKNVFYPGDRDPRSQRWSYRLDAEHPHELIAFLEKCHGSQDYRHWLSSLLRNDRELSLETTGSLMGIVGAPGSGKSFTLSIATRLLTRHSRAEADLNWLIQPERLAGIGIPRLISNNDLKRFPVNVEDIFTVLEGKDVASRRLYTTDMSMVKLYARYMFACVKLPAVRDVGGGFARRLKTIECKQYDGLETDIEQLAMLLEDPDYIERVANWALSADVAKTRELLSTKQQKGLYAVERKTWLYKFVDRCFLHQEPLQDVPVSDAYTGFFQFATNMGQRALPTYEEFYLGLERFGVPIFPAEYVNDRNGKLVFRPERLGVRVNNNLTYNDHSEPVWRFKTQNSEYFVNPDRPISPPDSSSDENGTDEVDPEMVLGGFEIAVVNKFTERGVEVTPAARISIGEHVSALRNLIDAKQKNASESVIACLQKTFEDTKLVCEGYLRREIANKKHGSSGQKLNSPLADLKPARGFGKPPTKPQ